MAVPTEQIRQLPEFLRVTIEPEMIDMMGHMNVRHYMGIFDDAAWGFFATFGMTRAFYANREGGAFALQQFIRYLAEVRVGETVAVRTRLLGRSQRRVHFMHFMLNETRDNVAATMEVLGSYADIEERRTAPWPPAIARELDQLIARDRALSWKAPLSGTIKP